MSDKFKFDVIIGNPPYQEETTGDQKTYAAPIYDQFMDEAYKVAEKVSFITPARFLFNAGSTSQSWNKKMLEDSHLKVEFFEENSSKIFSNTDIKGGVAVTYRDATINFGAIEVFTKYEQMNTILKKVRSSDFESINTIIFAKDSYRFTQKLHDSNPQLINRFSKSHEFDVATNIFDVIPELFFDTRPNDNEAYVRILGRENGKVRKQKWVLREYIRQHANLDKYSVLLPSGSGNGMFGETFANPVIQRPGEGYTATFVSIGAFQTEIEAENALKYVKTKFSRAMLGILKVTPRNAGKAWKWVPLQDFSANSDIDWTGIGTEIDKQLYKKYGLNKDEIDFIESHVKEMS